MPFKATQKEFLSVSEMTFNEGYCYSLSYSFTHLPD